jgi:hypothetical protein
MYVNSHYFTATKNERVQIDLEEQTKQLDQAKVEFNKLQSSAVRFSFCECLVGFSALSMNRHQSQSCRTKMGC